MDHETDPWERNPRTRIVGFLRSVISFTRFESATFSTDRAIKSIGYNQLDNWHIGDVKMAEN